MEMVLLGEISPKVAQHIAEGAALDDKRADTITHPEMQMLANAGSSGDHPGNIWRDIKHSVEGNTMPEPLMLPNVPLLDRRQHPPKVIYREWPIFLAQDLLHWHYSERPAEFYRRFIGSSDVSVLRKYWSAFRRDDPRLWEHPVKQNPDWQGVAVPWRIHVDGVPYGKGRLASADVANGTSPLATGDTLDTLNLWWWIPKAVCATEKKHGVCTRKRLWRASIWDLLCCTRGEFLPYDWKA